MACPYFIPSEPDERELWNHRHRLPLGDGFAGSCGVHGHETHCDDNTVRMHCNLGYSGCEHLPSERAFDAVRFLIQGEGAMVRVQFACEREHQPAACGELHYDQSLQAWLEVPDPAVIRLAEAAVRAWVKRSTARAH